MWEPKEDHKEVREGFMVFEAEADGIDKGASEGRRLRPELEASSNERARQRGSEGSGEERERSGRGAPRGSPAVYASSTPRVQMSWFPALAARVRVSFSDSSRSSLEH